MSCCNTTDERPQPRDLARQINVEDKRLINCRQVDVNQLIGGLFGGLAIVVFVLCVLDGLAPSDDSDLPDAAAEAFDVA